ncbi:MAG: hypothetical protein OHK93_007949 [Ramalina farinacea]|uniref:Uncharacterized protein n=1 Tax=Ramalina farinacea TaxID=258253 RepID=A0AA43TUL3_9LECA|nr:hypothetical protein [Ramalina farinacea]
MSQESGNCPNYYELRRPGIAISFSFASATYGAFHALAWSASSLQKAEMILWRVARVGTDCATIRGHDDSSIEASFNKKLYVPTDNVYFGSQHGEKTRNADFIPSGPK